MEQSPKISVITVCRNALGALEKTAESVGRQTYGNIEYIVIDGASTDGSREYLESLGDKIDILVSEPDKGIYDAMNKGIARASGEWLIFMNAGDTFAGDDTLTSIFDAPNDFSDYGIIYGDVIKVGADGIPRQKRAEKPHNCHRMFFCHQSSFIRRTVAVATPFDTRYRMSADLCQMKTLIRKGIRFKQIELPVANFDTSGVSNARRSDGLRENISIVSRTDSLISKIKLLPRLYIPYLLCRLRGK